MRQTFLDLSRGYSETLRYSSPYASHPDGYTRDFELKRPIAQLTQSTTCYFDGHIVTEGYIDFLLREPLFNPSEFAYRLQRHLQLSKEVLEGIATNICLLVHLEGLDGLTWPIIWNGRVDEHKEYAGYHNDLVEPVNVADIAGRDDWNLVMPVVKTVLVETARVFQMDSIPQTYWDKLGHLSYAQVPGR